MGWDPSVEPQSLLVEGAIVRVTHIALNVMSLLLALVGLAVTATFFVGSPFPEQQAEASAVDAREPAVPAINPPKSVEERALRPRERRVIVPVPEDKTLRVTVPKMKRVENAKIPYASGTDEDAFRTHAAVHLEGSGFPWHKTANVYIAGHRLGYVGTPSFLAFWDLNEVDVGDKIFVSDAMDRRYTYKVFKDFIVDPTDVSVTRPLKGRNIVTLQTCTLPDYSRRLIIQAERVSERMSSGARKDATR
jgi:sortase A